MAFKPYPPKKYDTKLTALQLSDLISSLKESYNQTTGEDDLQLHDFHGTLAALEAAVGSSATPITVVNTESHGRHSTPEIRTRYTMEVEFILDMVPGAWHQPEDLMNWIATHSYVTKVTHDPTPKEA